MKEILFLILLFPAISSLICSIVSFFNKKTLTLFQEYVLGAFSSLFGALIPFILSLVLFWRIDQDSAAVVTFANWFSVSGLSIDFAYRVDELSLLMMLVVTGVGGLIHVYSIGYMSHEKDFSRFFSYLNLFILSMLNLVLGENLVITFLGWEGVGLCSYLLISFWYDRPFEGVKIKTTTDAAYKAFVMNRIGDVVFLIAIFICFAEVGSLKYHDILNAELDETAVLFLAGLLFFACTGKSAQFPLFTWLPDAMAGPTSVSALIHAATMVTSGLFLTARLSPLFANSIEISFVIYVIGVLTAFFAASFALVQTDMKKVLAYSTVSQLGFMFLAVGIGAYSVAIFHVITHAFFKACLFLGSGSVIHAMHGEQDIRNMGGLNKKMPLTSKTFLIASLSLAGFPLSAGFFSKDAIVTSTFVSTAGISIYIIAMIVAFMTAAYSMRLYVFVFLGQPRSNRATNAQESNKLMTLPLIILAVFSVLGGLIGLPKVLSQTNWINSWLTPSPVTAIEVHHLSSLAEWGLMILSSTVAILGIVLGWLIWKKEIQSPFLRNEPKGIRSFFYKKWYIDEIYHGVFVVGLLGTLKSIFVIIEGLISMIIDIIGWTCIGISKLFSNMQTGSPQVYATIIVIGGTIFVWLMLL